MFHFQMNILLVKKEEGTKVPRDFTILHANNDDTLQVILNGHRPPPEYVDVPVQTAESLCKERQASKDSASGHGQHSMEF